MPYYDEPDENVWREVHRIHLAAFPEEDVDSKLPDTWAGGEGIHARPKPKPTKANKKCPIKFVNGDEDGSRGFADLWMLGGSHGVAMLTFLTLYKPVTRRRPTRIGLLCNGRC